MFSVFLSRLFDGRYKFSSSAPEAFLTLAFLASIKKSSDSDLSSYGLGSKSENMSS